MLSWYTIPSFTLQGSVRLSQYLTSLAFDNCNPTHLLAGFVREFVHDGPLDHESGVGRVDLTNGLVTDIIYDSGRSG